MRGLYAIVDTDTLSRRAIPVAPFAEAVLDARPAAIQLRDKASGARATLELLRAIQPLAARSGVPLFANDRPDLALLAGCDGVHVGQDDVPVALVRKIGDGSLKVGLSTHDAAQIDAIDDVPDYVAIGPIFATASKERPSPVVGVGGLGELASRARRVLRGKGAPIVAIGGITLETAADVGAIADCVAVIGALLPSSREAEGWSLSRVLDAVRDRSRAIHQAVARARDASPGGDT
jgi:thiamine-phosphate pyrophosphorylase